MFYRIICTLNATVLLLFNRSNPFTVKYYFRDININVKKV